MDHIEIFQGNIRDPNGVEEATKAVDMVFHIGSINSDSV